MSNPNYKNSSKHRAKHGNYYKKPTQQGVNALNSLYEGIDSIVKSGIEHGQTFPAIASPSFPKGQLKIPFK